MSLKSNNEKLLQTSKEVNFEEFNKTICDEEHFRLSQRNLIMMYSYLYNFVINNNLKGFNTYLNNTTYFNKIIFLKYLMFFRKFNELQKRMLNDINTKILDLTNDINKLDTTLKPLQEEIHELQTDIDELEELNDKLEELNDKLKEDQNAENYEANINKINDNENKIEENGIIIATNEDNIEQIIKDDMEPMEKAKKKKEKSLLDFTSRLSMFEDMKNEFSLNTKDILGKNINAKDSINSLFNETIIDKIYNTIIKNIYENWDNSFQQYLTLFHLNNEPINKSSKQAIFYIGVHGTLCIVVPNNQYLTIQTPIDTTINRWGEMGEVVKYFNTMDYTFKQCLLTYGENLNIDNAKACFNLLGDSQKEHNLDTMRTTPAYCEIEPNNYFSKLTEFKKNEKIRIKHYSVDSHNYMIFNSDYTIPDDLFPNLSYKNQILDKNKILDKRTQYNTAERIINLNFLLFTNNIDFTIFNELNIRDETKVNTFGLFSDIGLYTRYYLDANHIFIQSDLHDFDFPLDIFSFKFKTRLFTEDFTLDRDIYALNDINIHLTYQKVDRSFLDRSFKLFKGDSFSCNPYIIEYFINKFNSKIIIRPGPILGNKEDDRFKQNSQPGTNSEKGSTVTCLTKGLTCYKVTLAVLTNYEILQFCKDANIKTCDLYDTSCQSFLYLDTFGQIIPNYNPPPEEALKLKRTPTINDTAMLPKYDNLSDIFLTMNPDLGIARDFLVVGQGQKRKNETIDGGRTKKSINRKKNCCKQTKKSCKQKKGKTNKGKTKKGKTKKRKDKKK
jgi:predicted  nucleic acid-binding Zn-ribbon protein